MAQQWRCLASLISPASPLSRPARLPSSLGFTRLISARLSLPPFLALLLQIRRALFLFTPTLQANPRPQNTISYVLDIRPQIMFNHSPQAISCCPSQEQCLVHSSRCALLSLCSPNSFAAAMKKSDEDPASEYQVGVQKVPIQPRRLLLAVPVTLRRMMNATPPAIAPPPHLLHPARLAVWLFQSPSSSFILGTLPFQPPSKSASAKQNPPSLLEAEAHPGKTARTFLNRRNLAPRRPALLPPLSSTLPSLCIFAVRAPFNSAAKYTGTLPFQPDSSKQISLRKTRQCHRSCIAQSQ
ncbi:hypothetical protein DFH08DRAFT_968367 [Mycena albidolilacea]|uniref:Uncharacterized protein n=1 Tax=Mycena albidolilacea TaxID=1033008 RepID=A0AAD6ZKR2_9AGAR|nr:hypothetical protein DFH08DRAFT_968367 [Mycena albidolilacea]